MIMIAIISDRENPLAVMLPAVPKDVVSNLAEIFGHLGSIGTFESSVHLTAALCPSPRPTPPLVPGPIDATGG